MTTALQSYTSAIVTPDFKFLYYPDFQPSNLANSWFGSISDNKHSRYIRNLTASDRIRDISLWDNISALECADYKQFQTERSTLLIIIDEAPKQIFLSQDIRLRPCASPFIPHMVTGFLQTKLYPTWGTENNDWAKCVNTSQWHTQILYCLSRKVPDRSRLQIHLWLLLTATVLSAIKLGCLLYTFKEQQETPLLTTGDAIASFLRSRCVHSAGMCLLSQEEIIRKLKEQRDGNNVNAVLTFKRFEIRQLRYYRLVGFSRWIVYVSLYEHS